MVLRYIKIVLRALLKVITFLGVTACLCVALIYGRLAMGPIDLSYFQASIIKGLNQYNEFLDLDFQRPQMVWQGWHHPLEIEAHHIHIRNQQERYFKAHIPRISATFRLRSLLYGEFVPASLKIVNPEFTILEEAILQENAKAQNGPAGKQEFITTLLHPGNQSKILKRLTIEKAKIVMEAPQSWGQWLLPQVSLRLERGSGDLEASLDVHLSGTGSFTLQGGFDHHRQQWYAFSRFDGINPSSIVQHFCLDHFSALSKISELFKQINLPLSGEFQTVLKEDLGLISTAFSLKADQGSLTLNNLLPLPLLVRNFHVNGSYENNSLKFIKAILKLPDGELKVDAKGQYDSRQATLTFSSHGQLTGFPFSRLNLYWPQDMARPAREWVTRNIPKGHVPIATLNMDGQLHMPTQDLKVEALNGEIRLQDTLLTYLEKMPPVNGIEAVAHYDKDQFSILIGAGETLKDLKVKEGHVQITGLGQTLQHIKINLNIAGPVAKALALISSKPLSLTENMGFSLANTNGHIQTNLHLAFPLLTKLSMKDVQVGLRGNIDQLSIVNPVDFMPLTASEGKASIEIDNGHLQIQGNIKINGDAARVDWEKHFSEGSPFSSKLRISTLLTPPGLRQLLPNFSGTFEGQIPVQLSYNIDKSDKGQLDFNADLSSSAFKGGGYQKPFDKPGKVSALLISQKGKFSHLKNLDIKIGSDVFIHAKGEFDLQGKFFNTLEVKPFKYGQTHLQANLRPHRHTGHRLTINGDTLDLKPYIDSLSSSEKKVSSIPLNFDVVAEIHKIILDDKAFFNNAFHLTYHDKFVQSFSYVAAVALDSSQNFSATMFPTPKGQRFVLKCDQAGELFKALGFFRNFHGGHLKLAATRPHPRDAIAPWDGKFLIEGFKLSQVPFLGRLISLAFPTGFADFFSRDKNLSFDQLKIRFKANSDKLLITSGRAHGPSLGFTIRGSIQNHLNDLNIHGSIIPAYFLNTLISRIPLFGQIITGGKHEGIFGVSYTVQGVRNNPDIKVNPVSAFTPGFLRHLFAPSGADNIDFEDKEEPEDSEEDL